MLKKQLTALLLFVLCISIPVTAFGASIDEVRDIVKDNYVGDIDGNLDQATSIHEMMDMLDPYSTYFTAEEFESFISGVELTSVGIGVVIEKVDNGINITQVIDGGSAKFAGLKVGDIITTIDGTPTAALTIEQASARIKGAANTSVSLTILREDGTILTKDLVRKAFSLPNVAAEMLYGNVGYISLNSFSNDTASLIAKSIRDLKNKGAKAFIFDLQNNGGGYVSAAEQLIGMFPNATYAYKLQEASVTSNVRALKQTTQFPENTKVLINAHSASASEMTAAALLDQNAAKLYGQTTYGKGAMQGFFELEDGSFLKLTVGHFFGPKGTVINHTGVKPHVKTTGNAIYKAHFDTIASGLINYKEMKAKKNVPLNKSFTVKFSKSITTKLDPTAVELVALGGGSIESTVNVSNEQLVVTPKKPLDAGKEYMLIIHPKVKTDNGQSLKTGVYLHVTTTK
ncbi:S41 family peptidase [Solibacillus daqui]|uniref:S41 family peptidase n=1 Tax=Solibacillus daqui TaxID=2912187 RepID=UPI0023665501|nr:S41 family peptidase [Solibacillus daqui]